MAPDALPYLLITLIASFAFNVGCVVVAWKRGSASTPRAKPPRSPQPTPDSENPSLARLAALEVDQAALFSTLEKLTTTVKRLSSRAGMRDVRERQANEPPPMGAPKRELRNYYGLTNATRTPTTPTPIRAPVAGVHLDDAPAEATRHDRGRTS